MRTVPGRTPRGTRTGRDYRDQPDRRGHYRALGKNLRHSVGFRPEGAVPKHKTDKNRNNEYVASNMSIGLFSLLLTVGLGFEVVGHRDGGPSKDFHTFREVKVRLKDLKNGRTEVDTSSLGNGHHLDGLGLEIFEVDGNVLFDLDLQLNRDLLPQHYFQKFHQKVRSFRYKDF